MRKETYMRLSGNDCGIKPQPEIPQSTSDIADKRSKPWTTKWSGQDILYGYQLDQWLCGLLGAILTTLPAFILIPLWYSFTNQTKLQKENGEVDKEACFIINFGGGILIWAIAFLVWKL